MAEQGQIPIVANWTAFNDNSPCLGILEFPLFTDAWITGEIEVGPYKFINTIAGQNRDAVKPGVILRYALHKEWDHPTFEKTDDALYHGGSPQEEIAALSSLILGIRLRAGRSVRRFEPGRDPLGTPEEIGDQTRPYFSVPRSYNIPNAAKGEHPLGEVSLLRSLLNMLPSRVISLVRSARMYQDALWLSESQPEFSWLLLVSAVESVANAWRKDRGDNVDRLAISKPELHQHLSTHSDETLVRTVADAFADSMGLTKKFIDFCLQFNAGPPAVRPPEWVQYTWDDSSRYKKAVGKVYRYRSRALHDGIPFPAPMCAPPYSQPDWPAPAERMFALGSHQRGSTWVESDLPMDLHLFEYIARNAILGWWKSLLEPCHSLENGLIPPE
jgi:hypothetical protein